jgi:EAL domain-containing protein (putative c-di-GMP-specific phosphodiesterase class I)
MPFPILQNYLARLSGASPAATRVWLDTEGKAQGRYFNCTLTSAFQPVRVLGSPHISGFEAFARSYAENDPGLSLWRLLDHAASDDESVELDRLCRMLHAINFYRQPQAAHADLFLSVHDRLLAAVSSNHGMAFRRILDGLGLPLEKIVLQLPAVTQKQGWLLTYVADNYRRNGFRFAVNAASAPDALTLLEQVRPDVIKVDAREIVDETAAIKLLRVTHGRNIRVIFKRVENARTLDVLQRIGSVSEQAIHAQGYWRDIPQAELSAFSDVAPLSVAEEEMQLQAG